MKIFQGVVKHTKMAKTATVDVTQTVAHPLYGKRMKKTKLYHVHDEMGAKAGDIVKFVASRPYSKLKKWKITEIVTENKKPRKAAPRGKAIKKGVKSK